jgi:Chaperone of endosialidase
MKAATDTDEIVIGPNTTGKGSDSVVIGDANITDVYFGSTSTCTNGVACGPGMTASNAGTGGSVALHAANFNSFSDMRLKKDIQDSDLGLDFIEKLRPVSYYLKAGDPLLSYGFIAQEVEKALGDRATSMVTQENDEMKTWELNYSAIIAPVVKALQEQQQEISELKQLVAAQQKEIGQMKQQIQTPHDP